MATEREYTTCPLNDDGTIYASAWQDESGDWYSCTVNSNNGYESEDDGPYTSADEALDGQQRYYSED